MATTRNEINFFTGNHVVDYLSEKDKYLFSKTDPKYKFNVIGAGVMGDEHIRVTMMEGRASIHGVYDINSFSLEAAQRKFQEHFLDDLVVYNSLEEACNDQEVDGLIICAPNYTHLDIVKEAIKSGKHIMLEKPMATNIQDAYEITRLADSYESVFQIGLQYRYKPTYSEAIHEAIERKSLGDVKAISIMEHRVPFLDKVNQWNKFTKYSGGTLIEKCCHYFDLFNLFAQSKPKQVYASGGMAVNFTSFEYDNEKSDIIDNATVIIIYENAIRATFNLCMFSPMFYEELVLNGDCGRLTTYEKENYLPGAYPNTHLEILCGENGPSKTSTPCYPEMIQQSGHYGGTYYEHKHFIDSIEGKKTTSASIKEGFWSIVVGEAAEESILTGKIVNIEDLLEKNNIYF